MDEPPDPFEGAPLTICIDFKNPQAYLANEPTWALLNELALDARWLPFDVPPLPRAPQTASTSDDRGARHRRHRAAYVEEDLRRYGRIQGIELGDLYRNPDTTAAGGALLATNDAPRPVQQRFVTGVFDGYWRRRLQLEDRAALRGVWIEAGGDVGRFDELTNGAGPQRLAALRAKLGEAGIFGVPAYVVDGEVFYGRAHLPMIRWLLTGKAGQAPI